MEHEEFQNWMLWAKIRGMFGEERADLRNGILCSLLVNLALAKAGKKQTSKPTDFMPYHEKPKRKPPTPKQARQQIELLQRMLGAQEG